MSEKKSYNPFKSSLFYLVCGIVAGLASSTMAEKYNNQPSPSVDILALVATLCYGTAVVLGVMYWARRYKKDKPAE